MYMKAAFGKAGIWNYHIDMVVIVKKQLDLTTKYFERKCWKVRQLHWTTVCMKAADEKIRQIYELSH